MLPTGLGGSNNNMVIPSGVTEIIRKTNFFAVENLRTARRFLKIIDRNIIIDNLSFFELSSETSLEELQKILVSVIEGNNLGVISEAGCPGIADPGSNLVNLAHSKGIEIVPFVGPSSILLALISSGLNGQNFSFNGYLPVKNPGRIAKLLELEKKVFKENQTQLFMETPYRNNGLLSDVLTNCNSALKLCIAADITMESEFIFTKSIAEWKKNVPDLHKRPTIFAIGK